MQILKLTARLRQSKIIQNKLIRSILISFSFVLSKLIYGKYKTVLLSEKYPIILDSKFAFSNFEDWAKGDHNNGFHKFLDIAQSKTIIFDVGAHIGLTSIPVANISRDKVVIAFEPSTKNRLYLLKHINFNQVNNIKVFRDLIGAENKSEINFYETNDVSGIHSVVDLSKIDKSQYAYKVTTKRQITLNAFCLENKIYPDLIKIDVEGAEFNVLEGASDIIDAKRPDIIISLHPKHLANLERNIKEIFDFCIQYSYQLLSCRDGYEIQDEDLGLDEYYLKPMKI